MKSRGLAMAKQDYRYIIVGGGLAGASAVAGIRAHDSKGSILLIADEKHLPYNRPPLSKKLWFGQQVEQIMVHDAAFYEQQRAELMLGSRVVLLDAWQKTVTDNLGRAYSFEKLLLATGGIPRRLSIPGGDLDGVLYYRTLDDYLKLREGTDWDKTAVVIGGGFIGSEMAAALTVNGVRVTMIFPEPYLVQRVFPDYMGKAIQSRYVERGITIMHGDVPTAFSRDGVKYVTHTKNGARIESDLVVVGIGIVPAVGLAEAAELAVDNGIVLDEFLQTSLPDIYAAGDNARFPYQALGQQMRIEHWDNALSQGAWAGKNMAGAHEPFTYMPYFYSDLFEFGYEAVGDLDSRYDTFADWKKENDTGVIYYLRDRRVCGVMLCNTWGKLDAAREVIRKGKLVAPGDLSGAIR
jgi:3-phenylpropionate/trans-cinnamate dioxygenase ferredoxin reductase subunit